ncbi:MAG: flagellar basal body-associated FliL family protein [Bacteriovoracaceae bacterium]
MADELPTPEEGAEEKEASGKNPLLTLVLILNTVVVGAAAFMQYQAHKSQAEQPTIVEIAKAVNELEDEETKALESGEAQEKDGILFPLDPFTANLAQGDGPRRYLRLSAVLKFSKESSEEEFKARKPQIRDTIISILNAKRPNDLLQREGKSFLKEEIKSAINTFLVDGKILDVYYVGFQVN